MFAESGPALNEGRVLNSGDAGSDRRMFAESGPGAQRRPESELRRRGEILAGNAGSGRRCCRNGCRVTEDTREALSAMDRALPPSRKG